MFENKTLDKAFQRALTIERKITPRGHTPQSRPNPTPSTYQTPTMNTLGRISNPRSQNQNANTPWCSFHNTASHSTVGCRVLKSIQTNKALFTEHTSAQLVEDNDEVPLDNPTEVDTSLIVMNTDD